MRVVLQRVRSASVEVEGSQVGSIQAGLLLLVGIGPEDSPSDLDWMAKKIPGLRIFPDPEGKMNLSLDDIQGAILAVSQFTLYGDVKKGRRPSFTGAAHPEKAEADFDRFVELLREGGRKVPTGVFGADMKVSLINDGPVTLILESPGNR